MEHERVWVPLSAKDRSPCVLFTKPCLWAGERSGGTRGVDVPVAWCRLRTVSHLAGRDEGRARHSPDSVCSSWQCFTTERAPGGAMGFQTLAGV